MQFGSGVSAAASIALFSLTLLSMAAPKFSFNLLHPKYWLTWLGFGLWYCLSLLPYRLQLAMGRVLGRILGRLVPRRRKIAYANVRLCFPELSESQSQQRVDAILESVGIAFFETAIAWFWPKWRLLRLFKVEGLEHLAQAREDGVGVLIIALHLTHLDLSGKLLSMCFSIDGSYRPHNNPVYDLLQHRGRERYTMGGTAMSRDDVRGMVKAMRSGRPIWYAPDQDYGPKNSIFVPFFGQSAATITATPQLARLGKARVVPYYSWRLEGGEGYRLQLLPPLEDYPSGDEYEDTARINRLVEGLVSRHPEQYLWVHRRFKTRPPGTEDLYERFNISGKNRKNTE